MVPKGFDKKMEALEALRGAPDADQLQKALSERNNFLVSKAAAIAGLSGLKTLIPHLTAAFDRFMIDAAKTDPQCWAKNAIAKAMKDLGYDDPGFFLRGIKHVQLEGSWGAPVDSATTLRGTCALALVTCPLPRTEILKHLVDLLAADTGKTVRVDAALAIAQLSGADSILMLRFKALAGDREAEVTGQCFASLLDLAPQEYVRFVADFLGAKDPDVRLEAAAALGACHEPLAVEVLKQSWREHRDPDVKRAILLSLGASRQVAAAEFLLTAIAEGRPEDAAAAVQALATGRFKEDFRAQAAAAVASRKELKLTAVFEKEFR